MSDMHSGLPFEANGKRGTSVQLGAAVRRLQYSVSLAYVGVPAPAQRLGAADAAKLTSRLAAIRHLASMLDDADLTDVEKGQIRAAIDVAVKSVAMLGSKVKATESPAMSDPAGLASLREWLSAQVQTALGRTSED